MKKIRSAALAAFFFSASLQAAPLAAPAHASAVRCGTERWSVKTLTDADVASVDFTPRVTTVEALRALNGGAPAIASMKDAQTYANRRLEAEKHEVRVRAQLIGWKVENDRDFHVVIAQPGHPDETMIAEVPDPACSDSPKASDFAAVRASFINCFGEPGRYKKLPPMIVDLEGLPFADLPHGQTGRSPNGEEIHPVLSVHTVSGACSR